MKKYIMTLALGLLVAGQCHAMFKSQIDFFKAKVDRVAELMKQKNPPAMQIQVLKTQLLPQLGMLVQSIKAQAFEAEDSKEFNSLKNEFNTVMEYLEKIGFKMKEKLQKPEWIK